MNSTKFFIDQHGCAKNQVDGELIISLLKKKNWIQTFDASQADLIIVNSCGFIESAKTESLDAVMSARRMYPKAKILLAGCLAERYANDLRDSLTEADGFFGNGKLDEIYKILDPLMNDERPVLVPEQKGVCCGDRKLLLNFPGSAFVKITEGCNNRCSFCAIPLIRGNLRSRPADEIITEIKELVSKGIYEINLIGQDLAAYGTGAEDNCFGDGRTRLPNGTPGTEVSGGTLTSNTESGLCRLIKMISALPGTFAVRLLYIHPDHFNRDILPVIKADNRFLHYFDIPFQNGDDQIIKAMNRVGSTAMYKDLISTIRTELPDAVIRTTLMTGFPGEKASSFESTKAFLSDIKPNWSGCFSYSKEDDTPAYDFKNQVPHRTAEARAKELVKIQAEITKEKLASYCGRELDVLIEEVLDQGQDNPDEGLAIARAWFQAPEVDGSVVVRYDFSDETQKKAVQVGRLVRVKIDASTDVDLNGEFTGDSPLNNSIANNSFKFAPDLI